MHICKNSLANMLGEFVAIQKNPDFKLSKGTEDNLNQAVKEERRQYDNHVKEQQLIKAMRERRRFHSAMEYAPSDAVNANPDPRARRLSAPVVYEMPMPGEIPKRKSSIFEKLKKRMHRHSLHIETIREEDEFRATPRMTRRESS